MGSKFNDEQCSYKKQKEDTHRHREEGYVKSGAETGIMQPEAKECQRLPIATRS